MEIGAQNDIFATDVLVKEPASAPASAPASPTTVPSRVPTTEPTTEPTTKSTRVRISVPTSGGSCKSTNAKVVKSHRRNLRSFKPGTKHSLW